MRKIKLSLALIFTILMNVGCAQPISHELKAIVKTMIYASILIIKIHILIQIIISLSLLENISRPKI